MRLADDQFQQLLNALTPLALKIQALEEKTEELSENIESKADKFGEINIEGTIDVFGPAIIDGLYEIIDVPLDGQIAKSTNLTTEAPKVKFQASERTPDPEPPVLLGPNTRKWQLPPPMVFPQHRKFP